MRLGVLSQDSAAAHHQLRAEASQGTRGDYRFSGVVSVKREKQGPRKQGTEGSRIKQCDLKRASYGCNDPGTALRRCQAAAHTPTRLNRSRSPESAKNGTWRIGQAFAGHWSTTLSQNVSLKRVGLSSSSPAGLHREARKDARTFDSRTPTQMMVNSGQPTRSQGVEDVS